MSNFRGEIEGFPKDVVFEMERRQVAQGNAADVSVFENDRMTACSEGGFTWSPTYEGEDFWNEVIEHRNFSLFYERFPEYNSKHSFLNINRRWL